MDKKEYVERYIKLLDDALLGLFDDSREEEIIATDKLALGENYEAFEAVITEAYDKVQAARNALRAFADSLE